MQMVAEAVDQYVGLRAVSQALEKPVRQLNRMMTKSSRWYRIQRLMGDSVHKIIVEVLML